MAGIPESEPAGDDSSAHFSRQGNQSVYNIAGTSRSGSEASADIGIPSGLRKGISSISEEPKPCTFWEHHLQEWKLPTPNDSFAWNIEALIVTALRDEPTKLPPLTFKRKRSADRSDMGESLRSKQRLATFQA
jgi:hypothetical protein